MHHFFKSNFPHGNVIFHFRGRAINDLSAFAAGYHEAGKILVSNLEAVRGHRDYEGYPILFLYRHALELYLKALVYRGAQLLGLISEEKLNTERLLTSHKLTGLLPAIEAIFKAVEWEWDFEVSGLKSFDDFAELINEIEKIEPRSDGFRYSVPTIGEAALPKHFVVNVIGFGKKMDALLDVLSGAVTGLEERWDETAEAMYFLQKALREPKDKASSGPPAHRDRVAVRKNLKGHVRAARAEVCRLTRFAKIQKELYGYG